MAKERRKTLARLDFHCQHWEGNGMPEVHVPGKTDSSGQFRFSRQQGQSMKKQCARRMWPRKDHLGQFMFCRQQSKKQQQQQQNQRAESLIRNKMCLVSQLVGWLVS